MTQPLVQAITFAVVTVAFLILAGFIIATSSDPSMQKLAVGIITGLLGLWVQSPVQAYRTQAAQLKKEQAPS